MTFQNGSTILLICIHDKILQDTGIVMRCWRQWLWNSWQKKNSSDGTKSKQQTHCYFGQCPMSWIVPNVVCLFVFLALQPFGCIFHSPVAGFGLLIFEVSRSHTRHATVGRTPLDEWSIRRRDLYLTTHNRQTSFPPVGSEPTISAGEQP